MNRPIQKYHENVLQSYRHKQLNTQSQLASIKRVGQVPGKAIWWHVARKHVGSLGCMLPQQGELTVLPRPPSWWGGAGCPLPKNPIPRCRPSGLASPLHNCAPSVPPLGLDWRRPARLPPWSSLSNTLKPLPRLCFV